ncbi:hypothetical protein MANES_11G036600v8 [Manihot esculenta]|uniref:Uncharacterized protein n=1 Tax=Manihot esculenta TaxID=3983 RepID=A0ACB7GSQ6_MANES|nr:hypothetical protein MANES_11G036600v8 [Manihot esculenta]
MFARTSIFLLSYRANSVLQFGNSYVKSKPANCFQKTGPEIRLGSMGNKKKQKTVLTRLWRPVSTQASSVDDVTIESENGGQLQEVHCKTSSSFSNTQEATVAEVTQSAVSSTSLDSNVENKVLEGESVLSMEKHSLSIEAINSPSLNYSHFISLPLAIHPELVDKLVKFQNSILGTSDSFQDETVESDSNEDTSDNEDKDKDLRKGSDVAVALKVEDDNYVKVDLTSMPLVSYAPKASKSTTLSVLGIDKSIFTKPKAFHLTVLMLKLWNKKRIDAATEVLKSISSKVMDALDNRPLYVRLKGLDMMRGSMAKARVLYATVEEVGNEDRLLRACQVITDAFVEAGLVLDKDAKQKLKLHATVMNTSHRRGKKWRRKNDSFDARGIFKQFGSEEWGEYLIREAHLSQRFVYDENGYYHCCASIPFPESMQVD